MTDVLNILFGGLIAMVLIWALGRYHSPVNVSNRKARRTLKRAAQRLADKQKNDQNKGGTDAPTDRTSIVG